MQPRKSRQCTALPDIKRIQPHLPLCANQSPRNGTCRANFRAEFHVVRLSSLGVARWRLDGMRFRIVSNFLLMAIRATFLDLLSPLSADRRPFDRNVRHENTSIVQSRSK